MLARLLALASNALLSSHLKFEGGTSMPVEVT